MFKFIFKLRGWKIMHQLPADVKKCVIVAAPHTSNWDFVYGLAAMQLMNLKMRFTIKKEWMRFPFKGIMNSFGALPIDRTKNTDGSKKGTVDAIAELFTKHKELLLMIPPEGTRSRVDKWKTGFYYVALKANVPLALGYLDYAKKECGIDKIFYPTGNFAADMTIICDFYKNIKGQNPQNFALDTSF